MKKAINEMVNRIINELWIKNRIDSKGELQHGR
jgi:hypothetical protein